MLLGIINQTELELFLKLLYLCVSFASLIQFWSLFLDYLLWRICSESFPMKISLHLIIMSDLGFKGQAFQMDRMKKMIDSTQSVRKWFCRDWHSKERSNKEFSFGLVEHSLILTSRDERCTRFWNRRETEEAFLQASVGDYLRNQEAFGGVAVEKPLYGDGFRWRAHKPRLNAWKTRVCPRVSQKCWSPNQVIFLICIMGIIVNWYSLVLYPVGLESISKVDKKK